MPAKRMSSVSTFDPSRPRHTTRTVAIVLVAALGASCGSAGSAGSPTGSTSPASTTASASTVDPGATIVSTTSVVPSSTTVGAPSLDDEQWFASNWDSKGIRLTRRDGSSSIEILPDVPPGSALWNPDWSPDGDLLLYNVVSDPIGAIVISDLDGNHRQTVDTCEPPCLGYGAPSWSRDGKRVAYAQADETGLKIKVFDVESGSTTNVLEMNEPGYDIDHVRWSPSGEELVGIRHRWNAEDDTMLEGASVVVVSIADGSVREITDATDLASYPDWHPSQDLIVFSSYGLSEFQRLDDHASNLFTIRSDGSELTQITNFEPGGPRAAQATWSPDGDLIVFTLASGSNDEIRHIATIAADGSDLTDLGAPGTHNRLRPRP